MATKNCWLPPRCPDVTCVGLEPPRHLFLFTGRTFKNLASRAGFTVRSLAGTAKSARFIYLASLETTAKATGQGDSMTSRQKRLRAFFFSWGEKTLVKVKPNMGEELLLIGEK